MKNIFTTLMVLASVNIIAQSTSKPIVMAQDQNIQTTYPTVPIKLASTNSFVGGCWSGLNAGYTELNPLIGNGLDDGSSDLINLPFTFSYYGQSYNSIYININGNVTFGSKYSAYSASGFPSASVPAMIAPFWGDVDLRGSGSGSNKIYYKIESNRMSIIWTEVGYYSQKTDLLNSFELILTDGTDPDVGMGFNARFSYDNMNWCVGDASGGTNGFGTNRFATVGAQSPGGTYFYQIGLFGMDDTSFDGAGGNIDGVHYLDGQCFTMDLSGINIPPVAVDFPQSTTLNICAGSTFTLSTGFTGPEVSQIVTTTASNSTLNNFSASIVNGNYSTTDITIIASISDVGSTHTITYQAIDDGTVPDTTIITIDINVYDCSLYQGPASLEFDGVNDYVVALDHPSYNMTDSITLEAWVRPTANQSGEGAIAFKDGQYYLLVDGATNIPKFKVFTGGIWNTISSGVSLTLDRWSHISGTYNGVDMKIYVNGELKNTVALTGNIGTSTNPFYIGGETVNSNYYTGRIDDVRLWDIERSITDIDQVRFCDVPAQQIGPDLKAMYKLDEEAGGVAVDSINVINGSLTNMDLNTVWKANYSKRWRGYIDADYNNAANWSKNLLPLTQDNGSIEATQIVVLPGNAINNLDLTTTAEVNNLVIFTAATAIFSANSNMTIHENFHNYGTLTHEGTVTMDGNSTQYIIGNNDFKNLSIDANVIMNADQNIWGLLTLNTGNLNVNSNILTLKSDSVRAGAAFHNAGSVTGDVTVERFVDHSQSSYFGYHYFSSPIANQTIAAINDDLPLQGLGGDVNSNPFPNIWYYDETVVSTNFLDGWIVPGALTDNMVTMKGYALNMYNDFKLDFRGTLNTGSYSIPVSSTSSGNVYADGWNFVGNPYPSAIDWDEVTLPSGIDNAVYFWDESIVQYASYISGVGTNGGTKNISSSQGFYIHATSNATFSLTNAVRSGSANNGIFWRQTGNVDFPETIKLKLTGQGYQDEIAIRFSSLSTLNFDTEYDAYKLQSGDANAPQFYTIINGDKASINSLDSLINSRSVPLSFESLLAGNYNIDLSQKGDFGSNTTIELEDTKTGTFHNVETDGTYSFVYTTSDNLNRFILHFNRNITTIGAIEKNEINIYSYQNKIVVSGLRESDADVIIYDVMGRKIVTTTVYNSQSKEITLPQSASGYYVVKLNVNNNIITKKVFINQNN